MSCFYIQCINGWFACVFPVRVRELRFRAPGTENIRRRDMGKNQVSTKIKF